MGYSLVFVELQLVIAVIKLQHLTTPLIGWVSRGIGSTAQLEPRCQRHPRFITSVVQVMEVGCPEGTHLQVKGRFLGLCTLIMVATMRIAPLIPK